ncbi:MAG: multidrug transporter, partial [Aquamicrobium sp.]|nr:multidrug transporter [Aquamicrobium sp.]
MKRGFILPLCVLLVGGCSMNPKLEKPPAPVAAAYPGAVASDTTGATSLSWREMFSDQRLQKLIELALRESRDLRIAALNVEAARAQF